MKLLPPQKDDCHPILADFGNDQFSFRNIDKENIISKPVNSSSFEAVKPFQSQYKKPIKRNTRTLLKQSAFLNDTDITDTDDPIEKVIPQEDDPFSFDLSLNINSCTSEKSYDSENEKFYNHELFIKHIHM